MNQLRRELGEELDDEQDPAASATSAQRAAYAYEAVSQAMRRGEFDNLPGAGKPLPNLSAVHDPNWWIKRKIERENLTGLGPPALTLRTENSQLDERIASAPSEEALRDMLTDFNRRVIEARRQLQGGPPVVTPTRDIDAEVARWNELRLRRQREYEERTRREKEEWARLSWRERRRRRRAARNAD